jgi:hypothetical protein
MRSTFGLVSNGGVQGIVLWGFRVFVFLAGHGLVVLGVWDVLLLCAGWISPSWAPTKPTKGLL